MWLGSLSATITRYMRVEIKYDIDASCTRLMAHISIETFIRITGKCVGLTKIYLKDSGHMTISFMEYYYHGSYSLHVKETTGDRQDIVCEDAILTHVSRQFYIDYFDWRLKLGSKENTRKESLLICVNSVPIVTLHRIIYIFYFAVCVPMIWTCGN